MWTAFCCSNGLLKDIVIWGVIDLAKRRPEYLPCERSDAEVEGIVRKVLAKTHTQCNTAQQRAIVAAAQRTLCLIQGPPGSGKTMVGALVAKVVQDRTEKFWLEKMLMILATTDGNVLTS